MIEHKSNGKLKDGIIDCISGSLGGMALVYVGQPLDTIKVKLQTFPNLYSGPWDCFKQTLRSEGVRRGLYAGTVPALIANVAENSVLFAAYGVCQKFVALLTNTPKVEDLTTFSNATAGFLAAFFSSFTLCPTELIKVQLQAARELELSCSPRVQHKRFNAYTLTKDILQREGVKGMFRGLSSTIMREMPGYFVFFGAYEGTRSFFTSPGCSKNDCGPLATMLGGAAGGLALWVVIFPADLVKSRIQVSSLDGSFYKNTLLIVKKEGFLALYSGLTPTLIRTIPSTAILFLTYETSKKILNSIFS